MRTDRHHNRNRAGFTLSEVLLTIAIITILLAVAIPGVIALRGRLKMMELDDTAREIFLAAQNNLSARQAAGTLKTPPVGTAGGGADCYWLNKAQAEAYLLPAGSVEGVAAGNDYAIWYNAASATVFEVYYSEGSLPADGSGLKEYSHLDNPTTAWDKRHEDQVGYYNGEDLERGDTVQLLPPMLRIVDDGERNELRVEVTVPDALNYWNIGAKLVITVNELDDSGNVVPGKQHVYSGADTAYATDTGLLTLPLDSLTGKQFKEVCPEITPGADIRVTATLSAPKSGDKSFLSSSAHKDTNSLFAARNENEVSIGHARHLQNLNHDFSGVTGTLSAVQTDHIDWPAAVGYRSISSRVADALGTSVYTLTSYDGNQLDIRRLGGTNGLFASFSGTSLSNIRIVDPVISGSGNVGALAGAADGAAVTNCRVYAENNTAGSIVSGSGHVGGLIGSAKNCTIEDSFAALPKLIGTGNTGGLIGETNACNIDRCYAVADDMQASIGWNGMFIGTGTADTIDNCYAVGNISAGSNLAGFANGNASISNSYCAVTYLNADGTAGGRQPVYGFAPSAGENCYYLGAKTAGGGTERTYAQMTNNDMALAGDWAYFEDAAMSHPYKAELAGKAYPFPAIKDDNAPIPHYGSWPVQSASDFLLYEKELDETPVQIILCPAGGTTDFWVQPMNGDELSDADVSVAAVYDTSGANSTHLLTAAANQKNDAGRTKIALTSTPDSTPAVYAVKLDAGGACVQALVVVYQVDLTLAVDDDAVTDTTTDKDDETPPVTNNANHLGQAVRNEYNVSNLNTELSATHTLDVGPEWGAVKSGCEAIGKLDEKIPTSLGDMTLDAALPEENWGALKAGDPTVTAGAGSILTEHTTTTDGKTARFWKPTGANGTAVISVRWAIKENVRVECPVVVQGTQALIRRATLTTIKGVLESPAVLEYPSQLKTTALAGVDLEFTLTPRIIPNGTQGSYLWTVRSLDDTQKGTAVLSDEHDDTPTLTISGKGAYEVKLEFTVGSGADAKTYTDQVIIRVIRRSNKSTGTDGLDLTLSGGTSYQDGVVKLEQLDKVKSGTEKWNTAVLNAIPVGATDAQVKWYLGNSADINNEITGSHTIRRDADGNYLLGDEGGEEVATVTLDREGKLTIVAVDRDEYFEDLSFHLYIEARDKVDTNTHAWTFVTVNIMRKLMITPQTAVLDAFESYSASKHGEWSLDQKSTETKTLYANRYESDWSPSWSIIQDDSKISGTLSNGIHSNDQVSIDFTSVVNGSDINVVYDGIFTRQGVRGLPYNNMVSLEYGPYREDVTLRMQAVSSADFKNTVAINEDIAGAFFLMEKGQQRPLTFTWDSGLLAPTKENTTYDSSFVQLGMISTADSNPLVYQVKAQQQFGSSTLSWLQKTNESSFIVKILKWLGLVPSELTTAYPFYVVGIDLTETMQFTAMGTSQTMTYEAYFPETPVAGITATTEVSVESDNTNVATAMMDNGEIKVASAGYGSAVITATYTVTLTNANDPSQVLDVKTYTDRCDVTVSPASGFTVHVEPVTDAKELNGVFGTSYTKAPAYKDSGTGGSYALMASKYTPNFNSMYFKCWVSSGDTVMDLAQFGKMSFHSSNAQIAHVDEAEDVKQVGDYVYVKLTALVGSQTGEDIYLNAWFGAEAGKSALVKCYDEPHIKISAQADGISLDNATDLNHVFVNEMTPSVWTLQAEEETPFFYTDGTPASTIRWSQVFPEESYYDSVFISFDTGAPSVEGTLLSGITAIGPEIKATVVVNPTCKVVLQASSTMVPDDRALISSCCSTFGMVFIKDETAAT